MTTTEELYKLFKQHPVICTDTRKLVKYSIFFALKGDNFNANTFAQAALDQGCSYVVIDDAFYKKDERYLLVSNVLKSLQQLAQYHRSLLTIPIIGVTGSNGKTTTKELIKNVLNKKYKTLATVGNLNNHIGVPLTLLTITEDVEVAIIEMGANHQGEIAELCTIANPDFGLITNIGKAHLEGFGGPEGVVKAKNELYQHIQKNSGTVFLNNDNQLLVSLTKGMEVYTYGTSTHCNCTGKLIDTGEFIALKWKSNKEREPIDNKELIQTQLTGKYNFENILAAICIGTYFNIAVNAINSAIQEYVATNNRSQYIQKGTNTLLLDAYNANPTSMNAAIENFSDLKAANKMLILGDMLELGKHALTEHQNIIALLKLKGFGQVLLVGSEFKKAAVGEAYKVVKDVDEAISVLKSEKIKNSLILIKGSRSIKLEKIAELF
jgi:UDP-N-acetylmuramoyl-tripeptide--D-alanyl-D-alanine ligase